MQGLDPLPSEANWRLSNNISSLSTRTYVPVSDHHQRPRCTQATLRKGRLLPTNVFLAQGNSHQRRLHPSGKAAGPARWPCRSRQLLNPGSPQPTRPFGDHSWAELQGFVHSCGVQVARSLYKVAFNLA